MPFVAETGGQNAMIVDSSALAEQVVADVLASAFDSAGQRCSALRVLCVQEDCADHVLAMLRGAMRELRIGNPAHLSCDVGPVITEEAAANITAHVNAFKARKAPVMALPVPEACANGSYVPPTLIEVLNIREIGPEVFGPVLHVLRFERDKMEELLLEINDTGYGLTFGLHTRLDSTIKSVLSQVEAGNLYVNRNTIGAVVASSLLVGAAFLALAPRRVARLFCAVCCPKPQPWRRLCVAAPCQKWRSGQTGCVKRVKAKPRRLLAIWHACRWWAEKSPFPALWVSRTSTA